MKGREVTPTRMLLGNFPLDLPGQSEQLPENLRDEAEIEQPLRALLRRAQRGERKERLEIGRAGDVPVARLRAERRHVHTDHPHLQILRTDKTHGVSRRDDDDMPHRHLLHPPPRLE